MSCVTLCCELITVSTLHRPVVQDDGGGGELSGRQTPVHGAALGNEAGDAAADGVAAVVDHAVSVGAAGGGVTGAARVLEVPVVSGAPHCRVVSLPVGGYELLTSDLEYAFSPRCHLSYYDIIVF